MIVTTLPDTVALKIEWFKEGKLQLVQDGKVIQEKSRPGFTTVFKNSLGMEFALIPKGKAWLGAHSDAAAVNVNGSWHAKEWGTIVLRQAPDSRDLTGDGDGWDITGVVSGKQIFLLFSHKGKVNYSAELTSQDDNSLKGSYSRDFMSEKTKTKPMLMIKQ